MVSMNQSMLAPDVEGGSSPARGGAFSQARDHARWPVAGSASSCAFEGSAHPLLVCPAYWEAAELPLEQRVAALDDPAMRERLKTEDDRRGNPAGGTRCRLRPDVPLWPTTTSTTNRPRNQVLPQSPSAPDATRLTSSLMSSSADDGQGMLYLPIFNHSTATFRDLPHCNSTSSRGWGSRMGSALRSDLRRRNAHLHAHALDARQDSRTEA